jgi:DNA-binding NarL/FixJ family response regulator
MTRPYGLSDLETAVILLIVDGHDNRKIAKTLNYSEAMIKRATSIIYTKMHVRTRTQAAVRWVREQERTFTIDVMAALEGERGR